MLDAPSRMPRPGDQAGKGAFYRPGFANDFLPGAPCHLTRADPLIIDLRCLFAVPEIFLR